MAYKQRQLAYEKYARRRIRKALKEQIEPLVNYVNEDNVAILEMNLNSLISEVPIRKAMHDVYVSVMPRESVASAKEVDRLLPSNKEVNGIGFFSSFWKRWMRQAYLTITSDLITEITETTRNRIRTLLSESRDQNLSFRDMAKYVTDNLQRQDFTRARSLTIARTESTRAANIGQQQMGNASNIVLYKKWNGRNDGRERPSHIAASELEPIPKDQAFIVGGYPMQYPGDQSAPANETVNCRCSMSFVPQMDADGLPIRRSNGMERDLFSV